MPDYDLKRHDNGKYYIHWSEQVGGAWRSKRVSTSSTSLAGATAFYHEWLTLERGTAGRVPMADIWATYDRMHIQKKVVDTERLDNVWKQLKPHFGHRFVDEIDAGLVADYVEQRGVTGATVRKELSFLGTSIRYCAKRRLLGLAMKDIPFIDLPENSPPKDRWLSESEAWTMFEWAADHRGDDGRLTRLERFLWLALYTGARRRSIETLKWDQVDLELRKVFYLPTGTRQTKKQRVAVPISKQLLTVLQQAYGERLEGSPWVLDTNGSIRTTFETCRGQAGLPDVTRHTMRHTAATWMARRGVPLWTIAGILGDTMATVTRVYAKHCPEALRDGVDTMPSPPLRVA